MRPASGRWKVDASRWLLACLLVIGASRASAQPSAVNRHSAVFDPVRQRAILFGGVDESGSRLSNETWQLTLAGTPEWSLVAATGAPPSARFGHSAIYDPVGDRMLVFGGNDGAGSLTELWALSPGPTASWSPVPTAGSSPPARVYHSAVYDAAHRRMIVYGGSDGFALAYDDVWSLWLGETPARWEQLVPVGRTPGARYSHTAVFDSSGGRMLVFGGLPRLNGVWALSLRDTVAWMEIGGAGPVPPARNNHSAILDTRANRMVVFGGDNGFQPLGDTWFFSLQDEIWSLASVDGEAPASRELHSALADPERDRMVMLGGTPAGSDFTWALALGPSPHWRPFQPVARSSPGLIELPAVTVGDTVSVTFRVSNGGMLPLRVESIRVPRACLSLSAPGAFDLGWGEALIETLTVAATAPDHGPDSLVIVSDDPVTPRLSLGVTLDVRGLDFSTQVLAPGGVLPLAEAASFLVTPWPSVRIEAGWLYYRAGGSTVFADSTPLFPQGGIFAALLPGAQVTEAGLDYYVRVENSGISAVDPPAAPLTFHQQTVASPAAMELVEVMSANDDHPEGVPLVMYARLAPGTVFGSGTLFYRRGGAADYDSVAMVVGPAGAGLGAPTASIPDSAVGPRGVEFWARIRTQGATLTDPPADPARRPRFAPVTVFSLAEPETHPGGHYRMLSVPLELGLPAAASLDALLADDLGSYDPTRWRSFRYVPEDAGYLEISATATATGKLRPEPGRAFWIIAKNEYRMDTDPIAGHSTPSDVPFRVTLSPGWNQVGDPFLFPLAWQDVAVEGLASGLTLEPPVTWNEASGQYAEAAADTLRPFEGYWVRNPAPEPVTLLMQPRVSGSTPLARANVRAVVTGDSSVWQLWITVTCGSTSDVNNVAGVSLVARDGTDALDHTDPPLAPGEGLSLYFLAEDEPLARRTSDMRSPIATDGDEAACGHSWAFDVVRTGDDVSPLEARLSFRGLDAIPQEYDVRLVDRVLERNTDLRTEPEYAYVLGSREFVAKPAEARFALLVGTRAFIEAVRADLGALPRVTRLMPSCPNPVTASSLLRFELTRPGRVTLDLYDITGRRVRTLVEGERAAGRHEIVWHGDDDAGCSVPPGVYSLRLVAPDRADVSKLVRTR